VPGQRLAERDADILDRVVRVDMQVARGLDIEVDQAMAGNLVEHVIEEGDAGGEASPAAAIEIQTNGDPGFERIPGNFCLPHRETIAEWQKTVRWGKASVCCCELLIIGRDGSASTETHDTISRLPCTQPDQPFMSRYWSSLVHRLTPYVPGEQPKLPNLVKLNTNENPYPPSAQVLVAIADELANGGRSLRLYPDPNADRLKEAVAARYADFGIRPQQVFVGNGSDEVLAHIFHGAAQARRCRCCSRTSPIVSIRSTAACMTLPMYGAAR
jgi:hypothetical protein